MKGTGRQEIDAIIANAPPRARTVLRRIRALVRKAAPDAEEVISYGIPSFRGRRIILHYAAFRDHIGIFPPLRDEPALLKALAPYAGPKGNLRFPLDEPMLASHARPMHEWKNFRYYREIAEPRGMIDAVAIALFGGVGILGCVTGGWLSRRIEPRILRRGFALFLVALAIFVILKQSGVIFAAPADSIAARMISHDDDDDCRSGRAPRDGQLRHAGSDA